MDSFFYFLLSLFFCVINRTDTTSSCTVKDKIDVVILIQLNPPFNDSSPDDVKRFIRLNLKDFLIGRDHIRVAMLQFAPSFTVEWTFTEHLNRADFEDSLAEMPIQVGGVGTVMGSLIFTVMNMYKAEFGARVNDPSVKRLVIAITNSPSMTEDQLAAIVSDFAPKGIEINIICANVCWETVVPPINVRRGIDGTRIDTSLAADLKKTYHCDPCYPDPCNGQGDCVLQPDGSHACQCRSPFSGDACQERLFDSFCEANLNKCKNGGSCMDGPQGSYRCHCPARCSGFHCEKCDDPVDDGQLACIPNPCKHDCFCVPSCQHADGYFCQSANGFFGRNCSIPVPNIECGNQEIVVTVSEAFVSELEKGLSNTYVYVSPRPKGDGIEFCKANLVGDEYVTRIALPFDDCSMEEWVDEKDGKIVVSNRVWLERYSNESWSMPIPAVSFECKYERSYAVVSSLNPEMNAMRLQIRSSGRFNATAQMCKVNRQCSMTCPENLVVRNEAVYTIGQFIHVRMNVYAGKTREFQLRKSTVILTEAKLTCNEHSVSLVTHGCRTAVLPTTISIDKPSDSVCLSFQTPRFNSCSVFFVKATLRITDNRDIQECEDGHGLKHVTRTKRTIDQMPPGEVLESIEVGPIFLRDSRLSTSQSVHVLPGIPKTGWTPFAITALSFLISSLVMLACLVAYCISRRK